MCKHEILIDCYTVCQHREWLHYTGMKIDCDLSSCRTSPKHMHETQNCNCHAYVEDIEKTRNVHDTICPGCQFLQTNSRM
ncbi:hypothetical protein C8R45DRAFT_563470 [Mycena sanguinolenta]|nr:hypothetical protein C8R45DRAFT_563470 [Mycena sanguinolenta]